jgi:serine/threonine-protein kinase
MPLYPNQMLRQRYQIHSLLGQGGFGAVYKALDLNLNRWCAVKENLLDPLLTPAQQQAQQQQFQREAMMLSRLRHQSLPQVHDYFIEPNGQQYLVMEFVEGTDLHTLVQQRGALQEAQAVAWSTQILDALEYLHTQQPPIIHRDIKPQNIIITPQGRAMLVDFGIAKMFVVGQSTTAGARAVSPGYSPPEQYGRGTTDARSDIYALGATLYFLLTGAEPPESVQRIAGARLTLPRTIGSAISPHAEQAILHAMELQPAQRFQSAAEMRRALTVAPTIQVPGTPPPRLTYSPVAPIAAHSTPATLTVTVGGWLVVGGVVVLLVCVILLYVGGNFYLSAVGLKPTPSRHLLPTLYATPVPTVVRLPTQPMTVVPIATPVPTVVRLPTQPPPTPTPVPVLAKVGENTVNIRAAPSRTGMIVGTLKKDAQVTLIGRSDDDQWYQIRISGAQQFGWVFGEVLQMVAGDPKTLPIVKSTPAPDSPPVCAMDTGSSFARVDPSVNQRLGCPTGEEQRVESAVESFQGGFMLWRADNNRAYVVLNNGKWDSYPKSDADRFRDGVDPEYSCGTHTSPPSPRRGFSKIWCNHSDVRSALGNATEYEQGFCMPGGGACEGFQDFLNGMMYRSTRFSSIYVFFADGTWMRR